MSIVFNQIGFIYNGAGLNVFVAGASLKMSEKIDIPLEQTQASLDKLLASLAHLESLTESKKNKNYVPADDFLKLQKDYDQLHKVLQQVLDRMDFIIQRLSKAIGEKDA